MSDSTGTEISIPVLIVGGGPIGMTLAMQLHFMGVPCLMLNADAAPRWHPKGATQNARTMELYRRLGVARQLRALGLPADWPGDVGYFTRLTGWELARLKMPSEREKMAAAAAAGPTGQVPEPLFRGQQMYVEDWLFKHVKTLDGVDVRFGWQCLAFSEDKGGVTADIEEIETGRRVRVRAQFLVGCDGGRGMVRRSLGIRYSHAYDIGPRGYFNGPQVSTYVHVPGLLQRIPHPRCWFYWTFNRAGRGAIMALDGSDDVLFGTMLREADDKPDPAQIARQLIASIGAEVAFSFYDHKPWTAGHALVADSFGTARVILCGDAAHLFTPTGGFGLNTGNDDAVNLGWKLAAAVQGWGGPRLIASYERERRPIAFRNTAAGKVLALNVGTVPVGEAIDDDSPAGEEARRAAAAVLSGFTEEFASLGVQLGARYDGSPLVAGDGTDPPPDDPIVYTPSACPGGRAPHLWLEDRSSLYDRLGRGFTLVRFKGSDADMRPLAAEARGRGVPLDLLEVDHGTGRDLYQRDLALIRPDLHVAWRGNRLPDDCGALLARVTGW